jgi:biotin synthase-like enzyme
MDLIIGTRHITPDAITRTATGVEVVLHGKALMALLNAAFHGSGTVEILGGDLDRHRMEVTGIEMQGRETRVTLAAMEARQRLI